MRCGWPTRCRTWLILWCAVAVLFSAALAALLLLGMGPAGTSFARLEASGYDPDAVAVCEGVAVERRGSKTCRAVCGSTRRLSTNGGVKAARRVSGIRRSTSRYISRYTVSRYVSRYYRYSGGSSSSSTCSSSYPCVLVRVTYTDSEGKRHENVPLYENENQLKEGECSTLRCKSMYAYSEAEVDAFVKLYGPPTSETNPSSTPAEGTFECIVNPRRPDEAALLYFDVDLETAVHQVVWPSLTIALSVILAVLLTVKCCKQLGGKKQAGSDAAATTVVYSVSSAQLTSQATAPPTDEPPPPYDASLRGEGNGGGYTYWSPPQAQSEGGSSDVKQRKPSK